MHNLSYWQIVIIGAAIVFGIPMAVGIVVGYLYGSGSGIFSGLLMFVLIVAVTRAKLKAMARELKDKDK